MRARVANFTPTSSYRPIACGRSLFYGDEVMFSSRPVNLTVWSVLSFLVGLMIASVAVAQGNGHGHGAAVSAKAKSACTAKNPHNPKAKANHGMCVSGAAKGEGKGEQHGHGHGAAVSAKAKSDCTAKNPHNPKAKPNHGMCVSAAAKGPGKGVQYGQSRGHGHGKGKSQIS